MARVIDPKLNEPRAGKYIVLRPIFYHSRLIEPSDKVVELTFSPNDEKILVKKKLITPADGQELSPGPTVVREVKPEEKKG